jgi:Putative beta-lactamase-inhibitor-like, PepSY-like
MRAVICGVLLSAVAILGKPQEKKVSGTEVPAAVTTGATRSFPKAQISNWSKETENGKTTYEASLQDANGKRDAVFSEDGALLAVEQSIPVSALPPGVKDAISKNYPNAVVRKAEKITHDGSVDYEIDLGKSKRKEITVSSNGKILKEE